MELSVKKIIKICHGQLFCGDEEITCSSFIKDTRILQKNDTYIGIKGANFDGNQFYKEAFFKGANCAILEKNAFVYDENYDYNKPIILVEDSLKALKELAIYVRTHSQAYFVGVTGSVGKTSTKDLIYSVLNENFKTLKTESNYNNNIGLPLTLLRLTDEKAAVIEMGMNHLGEIDYLSRITKPHISVITNIGTAHIGELGSRDNILKAKLEIINGMSEDGILIINNDNDMLHTYNKNQKEIKTITIGIDNPSDFMATDIVLHETYSTFKVQNKDKIYNIYSPVPGRVFVYNSLIAFAVGSILNIETSKIIKGIKNFKLTKNRMEYIKLNNNITLINDAYNASVDSMKSSLEVLGQYHTRKIAVLGDMLELGEYSKKLHEDVGYFVVKNNIDILITVGQEATNIALKAIDKGMNQQFVIPCKNNDEAVLKLKELIKQGDTILFKASNGMNFHEIINKLKQM